LALLSDAGHNLSDVVSLILALIAFKLMYSKATQSYTYGYKKVTVLVALLNALILFGNADKSDKFEAIHKELDTLENKLGKKLVHLASTQNALEHRTEGTDRDDPDRNLLFL
jgi:Co/Zn/Cd efflux system component